MWFLLFFLRLFSAVAYWMSTILSHMMWPQCEFRMHMWNVLHAARWEYRTQKKIGKKIAICAPSHNSVWIYLRNWGMCVSTIGKYLLNNNISSTYLHNMVKFSPLAAEVDWRVWGAPANFNGFRILASLLQRRRSTEVNQTLHDVWPSAEHKPTF